MNEALVHDTDGDAVTVLLVDDDAELREGVAALLRADHRIRVLGTAGDGREALSFLRERLVDAVLLDVEMPVLDGVETARILSERFPQVVVVMFTAFELEGRLSEAIAAGASSFLTKDMPAEEIVSALLEIRAGNRLFSPRAMDAVMGTLKSLGDRQRIAESWKRRVDALPDGLRSVYEGLIKGETNSEIARSSGYSESTVRTYVSQLLDQFECSTRTALAVQAARSFVE